MDMQEILPGKNDIMKPEKTDSPGSGKENTFDDLLQRAGGEENEDASKGIDRSGEDENSFRSANDAVNKGEKTNQDEMATVKNDDVEVSPTPLEFKTDDLSEEGAVAEISFVSEDIDENLEPGSITSIIANKGVVEGRDEAAPFRETLKQTSGKESGESEKSAVTHTGGTVNVSQGAPSLNQNHTLTTEVTVEAAKVMTTQGGGDLSQGGEGKPDNSSLTGFAQKGNAAQADSTNQTEQSGFKLVQKAAHASHEIDKGVTLSRMMSDGMKGEVKINLNSTSLGRLQVELSLQGNEVKALFLAESNNVKGILENNMQDLKNALSDKEMNLESFDVTTDSRGREKESDQKDEIAWRNVRHDDLSNEKNCSDQGKNMTLEWQGLNIFV